MIQIPQANIPATQTPTAETDSLLSTDTITEKALNSALIVERTQGGRPGGIRPDYIGGASWILLLILAIFGYLSMKYQGNLIYFRSLIRQVISARVRDNLFDDTVRETLFIILLNILTAISGGLLLYYAAPNPAASSAMHCILATSIYTLSMPLIYTICGTVFSDFRTASVWSRGATAAGALLAPILCIAALPALFNPAWRFGLVIFGSGAVILVKLAFISKSFRIFFANFSSWLLFLYYLCILEIIPLILTCAWGWNSSNA